MYFCCYTDFNSVKQRDTLIQCPHGGATGTLLLHGYVHGYNEFHTSPVMKGSAFSAPTETGVAVIL
jgi:hypothetical protein